MAIKLLFKRDRWLGVRTLFLMILSIVLMVLDRHWEDFQHIKSVLSVSTLPIQYIVDLPARWIGWASTSITTQHELLEENAELRAKQLLVEAKLQKLLALEHENAQLLALLQSSPHVGGKFTSAQLLSVNMDPLVQQVVLDRGSRDGVYQGQPVLDAYGVMGQVVEPGPFTSRVMLISSLQSAIPVQNARNGMRSIAIGTGYYSELQLLYVPFTAEMQVGDVLVTSGLGGRFPEGYPVGVIKSVAHNPEFRFANIRIKPSARLDRSRQVLLVWPGNAKEDYLPKDQTENKTNNKLAKVLTPTRKVSGNAKKEQKLG
ncbi:MAG: rod shape-determining protein MreC [Gammaproteobacteria bacterium]